MEKKNIEVSKIFNFGNLKMGNIRLHLFESVFEKREKGERNHILDFKKACDSIFPENKTKSAILSQF